MTAATLDGRCGVVFDFDGVIADSAVAIGRCVDHALASVGRPPCPPERLSALIGPPLRVGFKTLLGDAATTAEIEALMASYRERYREASLVETRAFPGIVAAIDALAAVAPLAIATTKPWRFAVPIVAQLGLADRFVAVEGPGADDDYEPKGVTLERALGRLGRPPVAVMIGDRASDLVAAHEHGAAAVGVLWGYGTSQELTSAGAAVLVETPYELAAAVGALLADRPTTASEGAADRVR